MVILFFFACLLTSFSIKTAKGQTIVPTPSCVPAPGTYKEPIDPKFPKPGDFMRCMLNGETVDLITEETTYFRDQTFLKEMESIRQSAPNPATGQTTQQYFIEIRDTALSKINYAISKFESKYDQITNETALNDNTARDVGDGDSSIDTSIKEQVKNLFETIKTYLTQQVTKLNSPSITTVDQVKQIVSEIQQFENQINPKARSIGSRLMGQRILRFDTTFDTFTKWLTCAFGTAREETINPQSTYYQCVNMDKHQLYFLGKNSLFQTDWYSNPNSTIDERPIYLAYLQTWGGTIEPDFGIPPQYIYRNINMNGDVNYPQGYPWPAGNYGGRYEYRLAAQHLENVGCMGGDANNCTNCAANTGSCTADKCSVCNKNDILKFRQDVPTWCENPDPITGECTCKFLLCRQQSVGNTCPKTCCGGNDECKVDVRTHMKNGKKIIQDMFHVFYWAYDDLFAKQNALQKCPGLLEKVIKKCGTPTVPWMRMSDTEPTGSRGGMTPKPTRAVRR